jgi:transcription initiation factor TFIIH subunit 4
MSTETLQALLATQPPVVYDKLYGGSPFVCKAMLQSLRPLARNYVMRLLFVASSVPLSELSDWNKASASEEHKQAIEELLKVHVLKRELGGGGGEEGVGLNPFFREGLKSALSNPEEPWAGVMAAMRFTLKIWKRRAGRGGTLSCESSLGWTARYQAARRQASRAF